MVVIALGAALAVPRAHGSAQLGGGTLYFDATANVISDSNVFGNTSNLHDTIYSLRPELRYLHQGSRGSAQLNAGLDINRYDKYSTENSDDWFANAGINIPDSAVGILSGDLHLAYFNGREADDFIAQRVDITRLDFGVNANFDLTAKTGLRTGLGRTSYDPQGRPGSHNNSLRVGFFTRLRPELSAFLDYSRSSAKSDADAALLNRIDTRSENVSVGLDGQLSPFVRGSVSVGSERTKTGSNTLGGGDTGLVANAALTWNPRPATSVRVNGSRGNRITANSQSIKSTQLGLDVTQDITVQWKAKVSLLWENYTIRGIGNSDSDRLIGRFDLTYDFSDKLTAGAHLTRHRSYSYLPTDDISRSTIGLSFTLRL